MSSLYNNAVKQSKILHDFLAELRTSPEDAPSRLTGQVSTAITSFQRAIDSYSAAANNEIVPEKKQQAQDRILTFREELVKARDELRSLKARREESIAAQQRNQLFHRPQHQSDAYAQSENPFAAAPAQGIDRGAGMAREGDVIQRAGQQLDEFIEMSRNALSDLGEQNELLRKTGQSMRKVANTLGISNETIRKVERRAKEDKLVFYGGAITMLVAFYFIVKLLR